MERNQTYGMPVAGKTLTIALGVAAGATAAFTDAKVIRVKVTADCFVAVGPVGTTVAAATTDMFMQAGDVEYFAILPGYIVSAIQAGAAAGNLHATPMV